MSWETVFYLSVFGIVFSFILAFIFLYKRIKWIIDRSKRGVGYLPGFFGSLRNLLLIFLWLSICSVSLFAAFFGRAYRSFTLEKNIAEIIVQGTAKEDVTFLTIIQFMNNDKNVIKKYRIKGDMWMLEGDILKWDDWLNFFGLHTRYRLTRLRGRYSSIEDELNLKPTIYSLVENEKDPLWGYLYEYGPDLPFVSTVYGNAVFQASKDKKRYLVTVSTSGFVVREISVDK